MPSNIDEKLKSARQLRSKQQKDAKKLLEKHPASKALSEQEITKFAERIDTKYKLQALKSLLPVELDLTKAVKHAEQFDHDACTKTSSAKNAADTHVDLLEAFIKPTAACNKLQEKVNGVPQDKITKSDKEHLQLCKSLPKFGDEDVKIAVSNAENSAICLTPSIIKAAEKFRAKFEAQEALWCALRFTTPEDVKLIDDVLKDPELRCTAPESATKSAGEVLKDNTAPESSIKSAGESKDKDIDDDM